MLLLLLSSRGQCGHPEETTFGVGERCGQMGGRWGSREEKGGRNVDEALATEPLLRRRRRRKWSESVGSNDGVSPALARGPARVGGASWECARHWLGQDTQWVWWGGGRRLDLLNHRLSKVVGQKIYVRLLYRLKYGANQEISTNI